MNKIISNNQSPFNKVRYLVDRVVVLNDGMDLAKRKKKECLILKVDFEKPYDLVSWAFLAYMLTRFGFDDRMRGQMRACVFSVLMFWLTGRSIGFFFHFYWWRRD